MKKFEEVEALLSQMTSDGSWLLSAPVMVLTWVENRSMS